MRSLWCCLSVTLAAVTTLTAAAVEPADALGDHMVLQRNKPAAIWGTAKSGSIVTVMFAGQTKRATADTLGRWLLRLDPMKASTKPRALRVSDSDGYLVSVVVLFLRLCTDSLTSTLPVKARGLVCDLAARAGERLVPPPRAASADSLGVDVDTTMGRYVLPTRLMGATASVPNVFSHVSTDFLKRSTAGSNLLLFTPTFFPGRNLVRAAATSSECRNCLSRSMTGRDSTPRRMSTPMIPLNRFTPKNIMPKEAVTGSRSSGAPQRSMVAISSGKVAAYCLGGTPWING